jgi:hypothetical protein
MQVMSGQAEELERTRPFGLVPGAFGCTSYAARARPLLEQAAEIYVHLDAGRDLARTEAALAAEVTRHRGPAAPAGPARG